MNVFKKISILFPLSLMLVSQTSFAQTAEELLPKGIQLEEVKGELEKAIEVYQVIIEKYPDNRSVAAKAYFHLGMCYEKLGHKEAEKAYNIVIRDYTDQEDMVNEAKTRLYALVQSAVPKLAKGMTMRIVWEGPEVDLMGEPSPDGKYISYVDWETGDLAIYEIGTGKKRRLTSNGSWDDPVEFAEYSRWSPDGKHIVFDWYNDDNPAYIDLYIVGLDGKEPQKLWSNEEMLWTQCCDWSPDGTQILACFQRKDTTTHIGLISTSDGSLRILKELSEEKYWYSWPKNARFSPDSRLISYDIPPQKDNQARDIYLLSTDGKVDEPLVEHPADDYLLGWTPDSRSILFASDRNGTLSIWIIRKTEDEHYGKPELVKKDIGPIEPIGFTNNGSYYFGNMQIMNDIYIADLTPATGQIAATVEKAIRYFEGYNEAPAYSPDGKYLAYVSSRSPMIKSIALRYGGNVLCIKSLETGKVREIRPTLDLIGYPKWSPDGSSIVIVHWNVDDRIELCQIDVQSGNSTLVVKPDENHSLFGGHNWSPSGKTFYYGSRVGRRDQNEASWSIIARDLDSGEEKIIYKSGNFYTISMSPDGRWFALTCPNNEDAHLKIISTDGGESRELYRVEKGVKLGRVPSTAWTADGNYILFGMTDPEVDDETYELCRIPVSGGEPEKLGLKMKSVFLNLNAHPNGRHITFSSRDQPVSEIWVMENFLPETGTR